MRTFNEFVCLVEKAQYDPEVGQSIQRVAGGEGGRVGRDRRKTTPERRRMKAVGGGKMEPVEYKPRKDIGSQKKTETRVQQPTQERGSSDVKARAASAAREERKKAALARIAAKKKGESAAQDKPKAKEAEKQATKLLSKKKEEKPAHPSYKPHKASGLSRAERKSLYKRGETELASVVLKNVNAKRKKEGKAPLLRKDLKMSKPEK
jgi:hypothetical protein